MWVVMYLQVKDWSKSLTKHLLGISSLKFTVFHLEGIKKGGKQAAGLDSPHREISEKPNGISWKTWSWGSVEVQACSWWSLGTEELGGAEVFQQMYWHIHHSSAGSYWRKNYLWLFVRVAETFCLWNISLVHKLPTCSAFLTFHTVCPVQSDKTALQSHKIRCMVPDNDVPSFMWKLSQYGCCCGDAKQKGIY